MPGPGFPRMKVEFDPSPAEWRGRAQFVAARVRELFLEDLWRSGFPKDLVELIRKRTRSGRSWVGGAFAPYSANYFKFGRTPDLTVTGKLLESLTPRRERDAIEIIPQGGHPATRTAALLALFHEEGTRAGRRRGTGFQDQRKRTGSRKKGGKGGVPARPFVGFTDADETMAQGVMAIIFANVTARRIESLLQGQGIAAA